MLRAIEQDRDDFVSLKNLQLLLIDEIKRAELRVRKLKSEARQMATSATTRKLKSLEKRIAAAQTLIFVWKCFGDGIAFIYLDKYALKHTYLSATNNNAKQTAGFLLDKSGFDSEWALLESAMSHGVPAVLADLTNTIRHGDLCLLGANDPYLIEVKSSKTRDSRAKRQKRDLQILHEFYEKDHSNRLRGMGSVYREKHAIQEVGYSDALNEAIRQCLVDDVGIARPEAGLIYIALRTAAANVDEAFSRVDLEQPWMFSLNGAKNDRDWAPYYPFTLTIRELDHLWAFVRGDIFLMILVGPRQLEAIGARNGNTSKFDPDDDIYPLSVNLAEGGSMRIASQALARIGMECVSPDWMISSSLASFQSAMDKTKNDPSTYILASVNIDPVSRRYMEEAGIVLPDE
ncbi:MAG: hypothetical protein NXH99_04035 [Rhodobacteraceae bacterium]|nr:hypothetical protein [Paracoccaceae bacterium]